VRRVSGEGRRIVVCFHEPILGGATRSIERIVPLLGERGWRFSFWVPRPSELYDELAGRGWDVDGAPRSIEYGLRAWRLPPGARARLASTPSYIRRYSAFVRSRRPALVHANSILTLAEGLIAARLGHRVLLHVHEMLPRNLRSWLSLRAAWENFDQIVGVSEPCVERLVWRGRHPRLVHEAAPAAERVELRAHPQPFVVGTVAAISTRKGSDLFVEAARLLGARNGSFRFEMVGALRELEQDWGQEVLKRARAVGIEHKPSASVFERFRDWDAFALPSRRDPFPIAMLEAMVSGLPVIGAHRDGIAEQVVPGTGVLVQPENPRALADGIAWMAEQRLAVRERLATAARERITQNFMLHHQAAAMDDAYRATLAAPAR